MENSKLSREHFIDITNAWLAAWSKADAQLVASLYCDDLEYRDPSVPQGIKNKADFIQYLELLFKAWPSQQWKLENLYPHEDRGAFSAEYSFQIANDKTTVRGRGMDLMVLKEDKVCINHVYLNADQWNGWIAAELKRK